MSASIRKAIRGLAALSIAAALSSGVDARPVHVWRMEELAGKADVLATGEVVVVSRGRTLAANETRWRTPILQMHARIRILRSFSRPGKPVLPKNSEISLKYSAIDWEKCSGVTNGPIFPRLSVGEIRVFPLRASKEKGGWELIHEEDTGLLLPATVEPLPHERPETGVGFLRSELAGTFARGEYREIYQAARYVGWLHREENVNAVYELIRKHTGDDQERWLSIATASYCAMVLQRPKIAELLKDPERATPERSLGSLAARALGHLRPEGLDDRLIAEAVKHAGVHQWGTAVTIIKNYPRHPTAMRLLGDALKEGRPEAVYVAQYIIKEKDHPLVGEAIEGARKVLLRPGKPEPRGLRAACELIRDYGDDETFALLLDEIRKAQKADRKRYTMLFQSNLYSKSHRTIALCRITIDDRLPLNETHRFCDIAGFNLQRLAGADFGLKSKQTPAEREGALQRAKVWLAQNPPRKTGSR